MFMHRSCAIAGRIHQTLDERLCSARVHRTLDERLPFRNYIKIPYLHLYVKIVVLQK